MKLGLAAICGICLSYNVWYVYKIFNQPKAMNARQLGAQSAMVQVNSPSLVPADNSLLPVLKPGSPQKESRSAVVESMKKFDSMVASTNPEIRVSAINQVPLVLSLKGGKSLSQPISVTLATLLGDRLSSSKKTHSPEIIALFKSIQAVGSKGNEFLISQAVLKSKLRCQETIEFLEVVKLNPSVEFRGAMLSIQTSLNNGFEQFCFDKRKRDGLNSELMKTSKLFPSSRDSISL